MASLAWMIFAITSADGIFIRILFLILYASLILHNYFLYRLPVVVVFFHPLFRLLGCVDHDGVALIAELLVCLKDKCIIGNDFLSVWYDHNRGWSAGNCFNQNHDNFVCGFDINRQDIQKPT